MSTIKTGSRFPSATLFEATEFGDSCALAPKPVELDAAMRGKRVVIVGLIGAFTDTCTMQHIPGYLAAHGEFRARGVDEIWCVAVNDGFAMGAWGRSLGALDKLRFLGDGSGELTRKLGLDVEIPGMGTRLQRCSMLVEDGVLQELNVEQPLKLEVSDAQTLLAQLD